MIRLSRSVSCDLVLFCWDATTLALAVLGCKLVGHEPDWLKLGVRPCCPHCGKVWRL